MFVFVPGPSRLGLLAPRAMARSEDKTRVVSLRKTNLDPKNIETVDAVITWEFRERALDIALSERKFSNNYSGQGVGRLGRDQVQ
jgi:hypothetical protein